MCSVGPALRPKSYSLIPKVYSLIIVWWAACCAITMGLGGGRSWFYFADAATRLSHPHDTIGGGLHLYAAAPQLQFGPVAIVAVLALMPGGSQLALMCWQVLGALAGLLALQQVRALTRSARPNLDPSAIDLRLVIASAFFLPVWMYLAVGMAHVDDVLALLLSLFALRAALADRPWLAGVLLGLAVDAKPWAVGFAGLLLLLGSGRRVVRGIVALALVVGLAWLPFFAAEPATTNALHFTIKNTPLSGLRALGFADPRTPGWDRPVQIVGGIALGAVAYVRHRWPAVLLVAVAARLVLDPGTNLYYQAGVALAAVVWDMVGARSRLPWWTIATCFGLFILRGLPLPGWVFGWMTVMFFLASCAVLVLPGRGGRPRYPGRAWRLPLVIQNTAMPAAPSHLTPP